MYQMLDGYYGKQYQYMSELSFFQWSIHAFDASFLLFVGTLHLYFLLSSYPNSVKLIPKKKKKEKEKNKTVCYKRKCQLSRITT